MEVWRREEALSEVRWRFGGGKKHRLRSDGGLDEGRSIV
jgi:hypothetical protein